MNFKKTIAKSLVVAMALGMVPMANLESARAAVTGVKMNGSGIATLTGAADNTPAYWGIAKEVKKAGKDTVKISGVDYKITNVQEYYKEIDVYSVLKGKGGIIAGGETATPDNTWVVQKIEPASILQVQYATKKDGFKGFKGDQTKAFGGEYGFLLATKKNGKAFDAIDLDKKIEAKLNDSSWQTLDKFFGADPSNDNVTAKLHSYGQTGSTVAFRIAGTDNTWASKESKVKIPSQAKGPNVKIDDVKNTTSLKKGMEYQVVDASGKIVIGNWIPVNNSKVPFTKIKPEVANLTKNNALLVRIAATTKKIASKYTMIMMNKPAQALQLAKLDGTADVVDKLTFRLATSYDANKGALLSNSGTNVYEYAFGKDADTDDKLKWNTLKAGMPDKKSPATIKPTIAKIPYKIFSDAGTTLFLRIAGAKQSKNNVITLSGISAKKAVELKAVVQKLKIKNAGSSSTDVANAPLTIKEEDNTAKLQLKKGTAVKLTIAAQIENAEKTGEKVIPKIKASGIKGVTAKASKLEATGIFTITIDIKASKEVLTGDLQINISHESIKAAPIKINITEKVG